MQQRSIIWVRVQILVSSVIQMNQLIQQIAGKLQIEGVCRSNYNQTKAIEILSNCVAKNRLIQTLKENEQQIIQLLESWKSW